jgi:hypothetical protein
LLAVLLGTAAGRGAGAAEHVTVAAIWRPGADFIAQFHAACDQKSGEAFTGCFVESMAKAGASPAALAFARRLDGDAYLQALVVTGGPVAVAHIVYPFRANENDAWLLVNGAPDTIDIDDWDRLPRAAMRAAPAYRALAARYPQVSLWPGERETGAPEIKTDGREFVVDYRLRDQCHACAVVGRVRCAFDFDAAGRFLGTRLVSVTPASG